MMPQSKYRILGWLVIILLATNLSTVVSLLVSQRSPAETAKKPETVQTEVPVEQRTRFFREQLNLSPDQVDRFREFNREFNRTAHRVTLDLQILRAEMVDELGKPAADPEKLDRITREIGQLHEKLKKITVAYYLQMKNVCDESQQEKLHQLFRAMLENEDQVKLPQGRRRNNPNFK